MSELHARLVPIRQRQTLLRALQWGCLGLLISGLLVLAYDLARIAGALHLGSLGWTALLLTGPALGFLIGLCRPVTWNQAATAVDRHYQLKDRASTALVFSASSSQDDLRQLQITDAVAHLAQVDPKLVAPWKMPSLLPYGLAVTMAAVVFSVWPLTSQPVQAAPAEPLPVVLEQADVLKEEVATLQEEARKLEVKEIETALQELAQKVEELKEPGVDQKEALAKLSEMEASVQAMQAEFNLAQLEAQLAAIGAALSSADELRPAGQAMSAGKFEQAAELLAKMENVKLSDKEARAVSEQLKQASQQMGNNNGQNSLSKLASEMCEQCKSGGSLSDGLKKLASQCQGQCRKKKIKDLLQSCCSCLSECKSNCQKNSTKKGKQRQKSNSASQSWGMGESGNIDGERTDLNGTRRQENLTGIAGEGPSETETTHEVEGKQQATRDYREQYQKYQKMSESVLDSEPIPLGHRQTIRKYFELIRPSQEETQATSEAVGKSTAEEAQPPANSPAADSKP